MKALKTAMLALHFLESTMHTNGSLQDLSASWPSGPLQTLTPRTGGSWGLFSLASLIYPSDASQGSRRGVQLLYPTMSGRVMTNVTSISYVSVRLRPTIVVVMTVVASGSPGP